ncbi:MAG: DUF5103 domain-containing protein [Bacteroidales bacterium]
MRLRLLRIYLSFFTALFMLSGSYTHSQEAKPLLQDSIGKTTGWTESNRNFSDRIHSVKLVHEGFELAQPVIRLGSDEKLSLSFDDLQPDGSTWYYTYQHCNADWTLSDLESWEYIDGYDEGILDDFGYSHNTIFAYAHYEATLPDEDLSPKLSGNYRLVVYSDSPENPVFTRSFMVVDPDVTIQGKVIQPNIAELRRSGQEITFSVQTGEVRINNPYRDLNVVVVQNGRWDAARYGIQPNRVVGDMLSFDRQGAVVFNGGNEFRAADIKSLRYLTEEVAAIRDEGYAGIHIDLKPDGRRTFLQYRFEQDINGRCIYKTEDQTDPELSAEYLLVHFFLQDMTPLPDAGVYLMGEFTGWVADTASAMIYDYERQGYSKTMLLKQGFYNYQYVVFENGNTAGDATRIEGSHWQTENSYTVLVYFRQPGTDYDQLIGLNWLTANFSH